MKTHEQNNRHYKILTSSELLDLAVSRGYEVDYLEPFLNFGVLHATHFIKLGGDAPYNKEAFCHEGIDGEHTDQTRKQFLNNYPDSKGEIWYLEVNSEGEVI